MIREDEVFYIGYISKYRGIAGEVELTFTDDAFDRSTAEYLVLDIDGIMVPYFWEEYRFKNDKTAILKFEDIDTEAAARRLVGRRVFYPACFLPEDEEQEFRSWQAFSGFSVEDENGRPIGTIDGIDDSSANILLYLTTGEGRELILPYHDDFLVDYNLVARRLRLHLPEGLIHLND